MGFCQQRTQDVFNPLTPKIHLAIIVSSDHSKFFYELRGEFGVILQRHPLADKPVCSHNLVHKDSILELQEKFYTFIASGR